MNPKVSVIIPTFGGEKFVCRAVESVLSQTYKNVEIIVVDDNGRGTEKQVDTEKVLSRYIDAGKIKYICHDVNKNGSAARNTGLKNSDGEYISFLDDDDVFLPEKIERQVLLLSNLSEDFAAVYCSHKTFLNDKYIEYYKASASGSLLYDNLVHKIEIATTSLLIRRSVCEELKGFDETFFRHQDWEFVDRIAAKYKIQADDFVGYNRLLTLRNNAKSPEKAKVFRLYWLDKMMPYINVLPEKQARKVVIYNRLDVALWYLKSKRWVDFYKEYKEISPGILGVNFMLKRIFNILKRGKLTMV